MQTLKGVFVLLLVAILFPALVKTDCSYERQAELSKIAGNVQFDTEYQFDGEYMNFEVHISNIQNDIYVVGDDDTKIYSDKTIVYENSGFDSEYRIDSNDHTCPGVLLMKRNVFIPHFNAYAKSSLCETYPEFKYCYLWSDTKSISKEEFEDEMRNYLANKMPYSADNNLETKDFILANLGKIIIIIVGIVIVILLFYVRRRKLI